MEIVNPAVAVAVLLRPLELEGVEELVDDRVLAGGFSDKYAILSFTMHLSMLTVLDSAFVWVAKCNVI